MRFVDVKNDIAFRKIFGNAKKSVCLISFLNAVLELEGSSRIKSVTILNPFLLPQVGGDKSSIIDIRATDQKNRRFVVEMQIADRIGFEKRVQFYTSRDYAMQIEQGEDYVKLRPTYFIGILNFGIGRGENYVSKHLTIEEETGDCLLQDIKYAFIQLPKFKKKEKDLITLTDKWTYFIKNARKLMVIPEFVSTDEGLQVAFNEAEKYTWKKEELIAYDNASIKIQDERGEREKAKEEGKREGREERDTEMIIAMYKDGLSIDRIQKILNLPIEQIQRVIDDYERTENKTTNTIAT